MHGLKIQRVHFPCVDVTACRTTPTGECEGLRPPQPGELTSCRDGCRLSGDGHGSRYFVPYKFSRRPHPMSENEPRVRPCPILHASRQSGQTDGSDDGSSWNRDALGRRRIIPCHDPWLGASRWRSKSPRARTGRGEPNSPTYPLDGLAKAVPDSASILGLGGVGGVKGSET